MVDSMRETMDWQPIETAPKDWTPILLYSAAIGTVFGLWIGPPEPGWGPLDGWGPWGDTHGRFSLRDDEQPTHWMPLPAPPES